MATTDKPAKLTIIIGTNTEAMFARWRLLSQNLLAKGERTAIDRRFGWPHEVTCWPEMIRTRGGLPVPRIAGEVRNAARRIVQQAARGAYPVLVMTHSPVFLHQVREMVAAGVLTAEDIEIDDSDERGLKIADLPEVKGA